MSEFICKVARDKFNTQKSTVFLCTSDEQEEANLKHRFGNRRRNSVGTRSAGPASGRRTGQARGETGSADAGRSSPQGRTAPGLAAESREGGTPGTPARRQSHVHFSEGAEPAHRTPQNVADEPRSRAVGRGTVRISVPPPDLLQRLPNPTTKLQQAFLNEMTS